MYRILDRLKHYLGWIAGIVGVILSWFAGFDLLSKVFTEEHRRSIIAEYYVIFGLIVGSLYLLVRQYMVIRKEKYANITSSLHSALHEIRDLQTYIERNERKKGGDQHNDMKLSNECKIIASRALTHVAQIFSMLTSTHCRASIKLFYEENNKVYVYSFARDAAATQRTRNLDEKRVANNHDPLAENNEMAVLFDDTNENWSFLSNDLPSQKGFRSTRV